MSDHSDLKQFLLNIEKVLDSCLNSCYAMRQMIRVEQRINEHGKDSSKEISGPSETDAASSDVSRQGGPLLLQGTPREKSRSTKETEKILVRGGRMETPHGRT